MDFSYFLYCPILAISPSELLALSHLPEKDKERILPVFPIKSWATAKKMSNAIEKIEQSIGSENSWIADIDYSDLDSRPEDDYREVHHEIMALTKSDEGYRNWYAFLKSKENVVPSVQIKDVSQFDLQVKLLRSLGRGIVVILRLEDLVTGVVDSLSHYTLGNDFSDALIILDLGQIDQKILERKSAIVDYLKVIEKVFKNAKLSISATSFPDSFGGYTEASFSIYERSIFDKLKIQFENLIYSDRGSARATKQTGGSGTPPPRIDYACKNEWHFIREELPKTDDKDKARRMKHSAYSYIARKMMRKSYWEGELDLYSNYMIELTAKEDDFGITDARRSTAVRINKHLYTQLHYYDEISDLDNDDDWID